MCPCHLGRPKMETNSFGNKSLMQPMRRLSMHSWEVQFFSFWGDRQSVGIYLFWFQSCSQQVLKGLPSCSQCIPNSTSDLSHMVCPKFNFYAI
jgi:hypothetical protein